MPQLRANEDIHPLSEFRANAAAFIKQVQETQRPIVLTLRGRGRAVLLDVDEYQKLMDELTELRRLRQRYTRQSGGPVSRETGGECST